MSPAAGDGTTGESGAAGEEPRVLVSVEDGVGRLTLNRPEKLNAFHGDMRDEIADGLERLGADDEARVVVVTGRGRAFAAGADVRYLSELIEGQRLEEARALVDAGRRVVTAVVEMPKPVIAALNGPAAGGGANLALSCDLRIAAESASIGQTFNRIGLHPDWGGTYFLPRLVGPAKAAELIFTGEMVEAREAERIGLVNRVVADDELRTEVEELAGRLVEKPALPLRLAKRAVRRSLDASLEEMLDYELEAQTRCFESPDAREGVRAFLEKRDPEFGT
ncbi:MAG: enoyl-CoA hydratase [Candidatus Palauibacterales bacterium]|nr:enoyl-CoA hydratase [Candidatus Palauibacterales bacterium]